MTNQDHPAQQIYGNRYEIRRKIARGGMADVYLAHDQLLDRPVALKVLFPELSVDPSFVERFRREAQNAARLNHPNIVSVYDWGEEASTYFIVMEYVDGKSLSTMLREGGPLSPQRSATIGAEVAAALSFAHRNGVVHRDVKPGNVLIDERGLVKVTDFGIARARNTTENLTQTGAVMGTATYFSPEQAQGLSVDQRSDVYSLGVVLYEMAAGRPPFQGDNPVTIAYKHVREAHPALRSLDGSVPATFEHIVDRALAKAPGDRYQSADELRHDLDRFLRGQPVGGPVPSASTTAQRAAYADATRAIPTTAAPPQPTRTSPAAPPPKHRSVTGPLLIFVALLAAIAIGLIVFMNAATSAPTVTVPKATGLTLQQATSALDAAKLKTEVDRQRSDTVPKDTVISQDPTEGAKAHEGSTVHLVVSDGRGSVTLDDYTNQVASVVRQQLTNKGLVVTLKEATSDTYSSGRVIDQSKPSGTAMQAGETLVLTVSTGKGQATVPNVIGYTVAGARQAIQDAGLEAAFPSDAADTDTVTATDPVARTKVDKGTTVNVTVQTSSSTSSSTTSTTRPSSSSSSSSTTSSTTHTTTTN